MKKFFSLFTALLFVGSMFAAEKTVTYVFTSQDWKATVAGASANWTSNKAGAGYNNNGVQVTTTATGANATSPVAFDDIKKIVITYNTNKSAGAGTFDVKIGDNDKVTKDWAYSSGDGRSANYTVQFDYATPQSGAVTLTVNTTTNSAYVVSAAITYKEDESAPSLAASPISIDFGTVEQGAELEAQEVEVTFANLTDAVTYTALSAPFSASGAIAASGDKISIAASTAEVGDFNQTLTIQSVADAKSATVNLHVKVKAPARVYQNTIDMTAIAGFDEWGTSYTERTVEGKDAKVVFASANHQSSNITDIPVTKGQPVELKVANNEKAFSAVRFICRQWQSKAQTITLMYSVDGGENYLDFDPAVTSEVFEIEKVGLPTSANAIKITFSSQDNQIGIESVSYDLVDITTALSNTEVNATAVKTIVNGQLIIEKDGVRYNVLGTRL